MKKVKIIDKIGNVWALESLLYRNPQPVYYKKKRKEITMLSLVFQWNDNLRNEKRIDEFLYNMGIKNVMIYGAGELGYQLSKELRKVEIKAFIDREDKREFLGFKNILLDDLSLEDCRECDMIIVTPITEYLNIEKQLNKKILDKIKIISIEDIVFEM